MSRDSFVVTDAKGRRQLFANVVNVPSFLKAIAGAGRRAATATAADLAEAGAGCELNVTAGPQVIKLSPAESGGHRDAILGSPTGHSHRATATTSKSPEHVAPEPGKRTRAAADESPKASAKAKQILFNYRKMTGR